MSAVAVKPLGLFYILCGLLSFRTFRRLFVASDILAFKLGEQCTVTYFNGVHFLSKT